MTPSGKTAKVWALTGSNGGAGVTSLAIQTGLSAIKHHKSETGKDLRICIIDLDFDCGAVTTYLDLPPRLTQAHLTTGSGDIDVPMTSALILHHASDIRVLGCAPQSGGNDRVDPQRVLQLMDAASTMYDLLILDVPRIWRPWTHAAFAAADKIGLVSEMSIPALAFARAKRDEILSQLPDKDIEIILNKFERRVIKPSLSLKDAERALGTAPQLQICPDPTALNHALNCGEPVGSIHSDSRFVKDVSAWVKLWHTGEVEADQPPARPKSLWRKRVA